MLHFKILKTIKLDLYIPTDVVTLRIVLQLTILLQHNTRLKLELSSTMPTMAAQLHELLGFCLCAPTRQGFTTHPDRVLLEQIQHD